MGIKNLIDTTIPQTFSTECYTKLMLNLPKEHVEKVVDVLVYGVTSALADLKKDAYEHGHSVGIVFRDKNREFIAAAYVEYQPNEENPNEPGNWDYAWTFYEDDLPENMEELNTYRPELVKFFRTRSSSVYGFYPKSAEIWGDTTNTLMKLIAAWLQENAADGEPTELVVKNVITLKAAVNGEGEIEKSIEVEPEIKSLIKAKGADDLAAVA